MLHTPNTGANTAPKTNSSVTHRGAWESEAIYLGDDENVDPGQDDPSDGHLRLYTDVERLVGHGERHHLIILQEGLDCDDDGVAERERKAAHVVSEIMGHCVMFSGANSMIVIHFNYKNQRSIMKFWGRNFNQKRKINLFYS